MLLRTIILVLVASLAAAAPTAQVDSSSPTSKGTANVLSEGTEAIKIGDNEAITISASESTEAQLEARNSAGFAVRCYLSDKCQGIEMASSGDQYYRSVKSQSHPGNYCDPHLHSDNWPPHATYPLNLTAMIVKTVIFALLASIAVAAPAAEVDATAVAPKGNALEDLSKIDIPNVSDSALENIKDGLSSRARAGMAIRCYDNIDCKGKQIIFSGDRYDHGHNEWFAIDLPSLPRRISCSLDTWNG
ncbi:uncharacterized protein LOC62_02G002298 [Vanrija pseudolonga]|uniref:Ecp2 effector protein domain-containing protein n=1 Tax=Vanrija pseudolonga TaxID=143232 RepID=A0AAF0Y622_9TREE|nr:hypothetical protein LOC62_02G002298 [Vanrija pseudolonga]